MQTIFKMLYNLITDDSKTGKKNKYKTIVGFRTCLEYLILWCYLFSLNYK